MRNRHRMWRLSAAIAAMSLVAAACGDDDGGGGESATTAADGATTTMAMTDTTMAMTDTTMDMSDSTMDMADTTEAGGATTTGGGGGETGDISALEGADLTVGSKEFTEQLILGAITVQMLEAAGANASDETGLVGSEVVRAALLDGEIDMYWEYSGTGWITHLGNTEPIPDAQEQYEAVRDADLEENNITWLEPAPFNNTYAFALATERAEEFGLSSLSDLPAFAESNPDDFSLCAAAEFLSRDDGLPGAEEAYGFSFDDGAGVSELELGLVYTSIDEGDPCVFGEVFATDGRILALDLTVLEDDQGFFGQYTPSLTVGPEVDPAQIEALGVLLAPVAEALDAETMQALNAQVDVDGEQPEDVATTFLEENGLLPGG